jgi:hypothetical protein
MATINEKERQAILDALRREFPDDPMMQELHYIRRVHQRETESMSAAEEIAFHQRSSPGRPSAAPPRTN